MAFGCMAGAEIQPSSAAVTVKGKDSSPSPVHESSPHSSQKTATQPGAIQPTLETKVKEQPADVTTVKQAALLLLKDPLPFSQLLFHRFHLMTL